MGTLTIVFLLATLSLAAWLAFRSVSPAREQLENNARQKAREILAAVEREIVGVQNILLALASSRSLQNAELEQFHRRAADVARRLNLQIVLRDAKTGQQLINTAFPPNTLLFEATPFAARDAAEQAQLSGEPTVSGVIFEPIAKQNVVIVLVPVKLGNNDYVLCVGLPLDRFAQLFGQVHLDEDCIVTIIDRRGTIVARSRKHREFAGTRVPIYPPGAASIVDSVSTGNNIEGIPFHWFNSFSKASGLQISVGVPDSVFTAPFRRAVISYAAASAVLLIFAIILSRLLANRLSEAYGALGIDRKPTREEFSSLFEFAPNGVAVVDSEGLIVLKNAQMQKMFGYSPSEMIGQQIEMLVPNRFRVEHLKQRQSFAGAPEPRPMGMGRDLYARRKDGTEFPIEIGLNPISTPSGKLVIATIVDITARKQSNERLSAILAEQDELRRRLMQAEEQERLRLARELHDQTGQQLTAAMLTLKGLEPFVDGAGHVRIRQLQNLHDQIGKALHRVARDLRPTLIDDLELEGALAGYVSEWSGQSGVDADFHCESGSLDGIEEEIRTTIYRIIQEALSNIAKHSAASSVSVVIDRAGAFLRLTIEDNGCGFDVATAGKRARDQFVGGLGIAGMRERTLLIGGNIEIESSAGTGTTVFVRIPLQSKNMRKA